VSFRDALYRKYVSTHIAHRKGGADRSKLGSHARGYRQHFGKFLPANRAAKIADLGCGSGALVWWLRQEGYQQAQGVDGSPEQVQLAQQLGIDGIEQGDVFQFLKQQRGFDLLFARDLLEHFDKQAVFDFLEAAFAALNPNGRLVLQIPNAESPYFGRVRYGDFTHELAFTTTSLNQLFAATEFHDVRVYPWRPAVTGARSAIRYVAWRIIEPALQLPALIETGAASPVTMNLIAAARRPE